MINLTNSNVVRCFYFMIGEEKTLDLMTVEKVLFDIIKESLNKLNVLVCGDGQNTDLHFLIIVV